MHGKSRATISDERRFLILISKSFSKIIFPRFRSFDDVRVRAKTFTIRRDTSFSRHDATRALTQRDAQFEENDGQTKREFFPERDDAEFYEES